MPATQTSGHTPSPTLLPGFAHPVEDAQQVFRAALQAFAHPGRITTVDAGSGCPEGLSPAMTALLLTLADADTPVWLPGSIPAAARAFLRFHCGCPLVDDIGAAAFVCVTAGLPLPDLARCAQGQPAFPDRSATLLVDVAALGAGETLVLRGPGIETTQTVQVAGLPPDFRARWRANHAGFPLGVDLLLTAGSELCGLPRTTIVED